MNLRKKHNIRYFETKFQLFQLNDRKKEKKTNAYKTTNFVLVHRCKHFLRAKYWWQSKWRFVHMCCASSVLFFFIFCFTVLQKYLPLRESFSVRCSISTTANTKRIHKKWMRHSLLYGKCHRDLSLSTILNALP